MSPEARGGDVSEGGLRFQDHMIVARIPQWLALDGFTSMVREALGDAEAKFFVPDPGMAIEFVEYKDHELAPAEFRHEIERFLALDASVPGVYRRFVLGCGPLSSTLRPLAAALGRVRGALPFYRDVPPVIQASYDAYAVAADKLEIDAPTARFIFDKVIIEANAPDAEKLGLAIFDQAVRQHLPWAKDISAGCMKALRLELAELIREKKASEVTRRQIEEVFHTNAQVAPAGPVRAHTAIASDEQEPPGTIPLRWEPFFGGAERNFPPPDEWNRQVLPQLQALKRWVIQNGRPMRVELTGNRRLSGALAIGSVLSAVDGFNIDENYRSARWSTDDHANAETPPYSWRETLTVGSGDKLAIGIGIIHDIADEVLSSLDAAFDGSLLAVHGADALQSAKHVNRAVGSVKQIVKSAVDKLKPRAIDLFVAGPSPFALMLGHRLNAVGAMQCYERVAPGRYVPTCRIWAQ